MIKSFILLLFVIAWAIVAYAVVQAIVSVWLANRRLASATAVAVAGAFILGALSPFTIRLPLGSVSGSAQSAQPASPGTKILAVACPLSARVARGAATGHIDGIGPKGVIAPTTVGSVDMPSGEQLRIVGWAVGTNGPAKSVCGLLDGHPIRTTGSYGVARSDVAKAIGVPSDDASGFDVAVRPSKGSHTINIGAVSNDGTTITPLKSSPIPISVR